MNQPAEYRIRLWGGRNIHAARPINGDPNNLVTACGHIAGRPGDHPQPAGTPVTCRQAACQIAGGLR